MRLSYFREFVVLARYLNFSIAARQLHMTQPGLSRHISQLEKEVGAKLLKRDTHRVKLTKTGERFLKGITQILEAYDLLCETAVKGDIRKITIGVPYYGVKKYLSNIVSSFGAANPGVKINFFPAYPDTILTGLFAKEVDVAIMPSGDFFQAEDLTFRDAFNEPVVILMNQDHPLATKDAVQIVEIKDEKFMTLKGHFGDSFFAQLCELFRKRGFPHPPKKAIEVETIEEAVLLMKPDSGVLLLPAHIQETGLSGNVGWVKILDDDCYLTVSLIHHIENPNPIIEEFINYYLSHIDK